MHYRRWTSALVFGGALSWAACGGNAETSVEGRQLAEVTAVHDVVGRPIAAVDPLLPPPSLRDAILYYVMPDRFSNGTTKNDRGDYTPEAGVDPASPGEIAKHGFDPTSATFYH